MRSHFTTLFVVCTSALAATAQQGVTTRVSLDSSGGQATGYSGRPILSTDGRFIAFSSPAANLVAGDTNALQDVFVHDAQTGATTRVSVSSLGAQANGFSIAYAISPDGRYVAFYSSASNLVVADNNGQTDVFLHDRQLGTTERVSVGNTGGEGNSGSVGPVGLSSDGRFVAFSSAASNFVVLDSNGMSDVFIRDRTLATTTRVSLDSLGVQAAGNSTGGSLSADGSVCAFQCDASLVPADTNGVNDIYVRDLTTSTTTLVSVSSNGALGDYDSFSPSLSANGRYVAFDSAASSLVPNDTNFVRDVFVRDLLNSTTRRVSVSSLGVQAMGFMSNAASISADGRYVAFQSHAHNLVPGDTHNINIPDVFIHDTFTHLTLLASVNSAGVQGGSSSSSPFVSPDGRHIGFASGSTNLVSNDTNGVEDVFVHEILCWPSASYCEAGLSTNFCSPAMSSSGTASASSTSGFTLTCTGLEAQKTGLILYGVSGRLAQPWGPPGGSLLCVAHPVQRTTSSNSGGTLNYCDGAISIDWLAFIATHPNALGQPLTAGAIIDAQCWYRDPPAPKGTNLSSAIEFSLCP